MHNGNSNDEIENDNNNVGRTNIKKKYKSYNWVKQTTFSSFEEAVKYLQQQNFVKFKETDSERLGMKLYYRCRMVPKGWPTWCPKQYMVHCPPDSLVANVFHNDMGHTHDDLLSTKSKKKLSKAMIEFLDEHFEMGTILYPSVIWHIEKVRSEQNLFTNEPNPTKDQVAYRLKIFRNKDVGPILN